jgi:ATP-binding cassette subfamily B protein
MRIGAPLSEVLRSGSGAPRSGSEATRPGHNSWAALSALLLCCLILDLGLIVQVLVQRGSREVPTDWVLGTIVSGRPLPWPWFGREDLCLLVLIGAGLAMSVAQTLSLLLLNRAALRSAHELAGGLRAAIHNQALRLGGGDVLGARRTRPEELFTDKVDSVREGAYRWYATVPHAALALGGLLLLATAINFWLTLLAMLLAVVVARTYWGLKARRKEASDRWRQEADTQFQGLLDQLRIVPLSTQFGLDATPGSSFDERARRHDLAARQAAAFQISLGPMLLLLVLLASSFLLLVVGLSPYVSMAGSVTLCAALLCAYFPARRLYELGHDLSQPDQAAAEIAVYLERDPKVVQVAGAQPLPRLVREIKLDRVTLADQGGRKLLDEVTFTMPAGKRLAIIGSDSQTAPALAGLLVRLYDPAAGRIDFDGHEIRESRLDSLRGQAILVNAGTPLFLGSVSENIRCGDGAFTRLQVEDAAKQARAFEFIQKLPQAFTTALGEGQHDLRESQSFRIGLARAALRNPALLIVQEPHLAGDDPDGPLLDEALEQLADKRTLVVLPGRVASLRGADCVYVFHQGKLLASGDHSQLLQTSDLYRHLVYIRFNPYGNLSS